jgi:hypothetical protein
MLVAMSEAESLSREGDLGVAYRRWREMLRRGWRRYVELLGEAGLLWPEGAGDDAALLLFTVPEVPDLDSVVDLATFLPGDAIEAWRSAREVTESSARRRPSDGFCSSSVQHPQLRSPA